VLPLNLLYKKDIQTPDFENPCPHGVLLKIMICQLLSSPVTSAYLQNKSIAVAHSTVLDM